MGNGIQVLKMIHLMAQVILVTQKMVKVLEEEVVYLNEYPYKIWKVDTTFGSGELTFTYSNTVWNDTEYKTYFTAPNVA